MDTLLQDIRYALRGFMTAPGFTAVALLTLGLGIGVNATVFSFVNALLLRPAPLVTDPASLVAIYTSDFSSTPFATSSYPDYLSLKSSAPAFAGLAAYRPAPAALLRRGNEAERVRVMAVSPEFFSVLGLRPAAGRLLDSADAVPAATPSAVLGFDLWRRAFGSDPSIVGASIALNGTLTSIVGIAPEGFDGLDLGVPYDVWTPFGAIVDDDRRNRFLSIVGRLRPGATLGQAQSQVGAIAVRLGRDFPNSNLGTLRSPDQPRPIVALRHTRLHPSFRGGEEGFLSQVLVVAVLLVLLIACANVASLLLSRATARGREMAIRLALGAGRRRLLTQMLTESVLLGIGGGALGLLLTLWTADALPSFLPAEQARQLDASVDGRVFAYTVIVSLLASVLFGLTPAHQTLRRSAASVLRGDTGLVSDGRGTSRLRGVLVAGQVALAMTLLVSASLLVRSVMNGLSADLGFSTRDAVVATIELAPGRSAERGLLYYGEVLDRVRRIPGVTAATLGRALPQSERERRGFRMEGYQPRSGEDLELHYNGVERHYFETLGITLLAGRHFEAGDNTTGQRVAIVNDVVARRYFGGNAVGRHLSDSGNTVLTIVGVVRAVRQLSPQQADAAVVYYPLPQNYAPRLALIVRTAGDPLDRADSIRRTVAGIDRDAAVYRVMTLAAHREEALAGDRLTATLVAGCGAMALALALVGIYGVVAYAVGRRSREIGLRVALGAAPRQILRLVLGEGVRVLFAGIVIGVIGAAATARLLQSILFGVSTSDPATFAAVTGALAVVALVAALLPARRALGVNPIAVLRQH